MAALAADVIRATKHRDIIQAFRVTNAHTIYAGSLVGLDRTTGLARKWSDLSGQSMVFLGVALRGVVGDTSASPPKEVEVSVIGEVIIETAVGGTPAVGSIANVGDLVYAINDNDFTVNATGAVNTVGVISRWYSSTTCDVTLFTPYEYRAFIGG